MASKLQEDKRYIIVGKPTINYGKISFSHPDVVETEAPEETGTSEEELETSNEKLPNSKSQVSNIYNS
jgi:hypothetical protein